MQARRVGLGLALALLGSSALAEGPPGARVASPAAEAPAAAVAGGLAFSGKTEIVGGPALQVVFGDRAVFHLDAQGAPVLEATEKGALAVAHPVGAVKEAFEAPGAGKLAIALDGSPQKRASYLKIWNGLDQPVLYRAGVLALEDGALKPTTVRVCAAPAHGTDILTWPAPVAAVAVANFTVVQDAKACQ